MFLTKLKIKSVLNSKIKESRQQFQKPVKVLKLLEGTEINNLKRKA